MTFAVHPDVRKETVVLTGDGTTFEIDGGEAVAVAGRILAQVEDNPGADVRHVLVSVDDRVVEFQGTEADARLFGHQLCTAAIDIMLYVSGQAGSA
jgi:hypothetical protein